MDILIYEEIGYVDWDGNGLTASSFNEQLNQLSATDSTLNLRINSLGGLVGDGIAIYNSARRMSRQRAMMGNPITINAYVEGFAYSSAATIAMAGDKIFMGKGTTLMIHNATSWSWGDYRTFEQEANLLKMYNAQIAGFYAGKSGKKVEDILTLMDDETFFTPESAIKAGLCDGIDESVTLNMKRYEDCLDQLLKLPTNNQYRPFMSNRMKTKTGPRPVTEQEPIDKGQQSGYNKASQVELWQMELDLEFAR